MGGWAGGGVGCEPWAAGSGGIAVLEASVRWQAGRLDALRRNALSVTSLSWESPAGHNFTSYLTERCLEIERIIDVLDSAARDLHEYGRLVRDAELLHRQAELLPAEFLPAGLPPGQAGL